MVRLVPRLELNIVTGFLGSGKTTLLKRYLAQRPPASTLVIINEFGRESIDDRLTLHLNSEIATIANGCLCCTVLDDLRETLLDILTRRARGELPELERIIIETSGLADPGPILGTVLSDENLDEYLRVGACVTTFDALEGIASLARYPEAAAQLAAADRVAITKTDLLDESRLSALVDAVRAVNPACAIMTSEVPEALFAPGEASVIGDVSSRQSGAHVHTSTVQSFSTALDASLDWATFSVWLTALLNRHGDRILRFKSVLSIRSTPGQLVVQGVRHRVYPPSHLPQIEGEASTSRLVFITDGLEKSRILESLHRFANAGMIDAGFSRLTMQ
ncbi:CobW family GTP-binding protein [Pandoraea sputorum]|uniref:CobW family GTP-binding protein n=1 Tax=Pandoraea sputorum TaxID=93222 RepID=UPI00123F88EF|nr:GTP-binding protein [Pandoraea sputorum]VVE78620.1 putative GTP-binding protein YjiA [Pandoraea sputorum]